MLLEWHISVCLPIISPINGIVDEIKASNISQAHSWIIPPRMVGVVEVFLKDAAGRNYSGADGTPRSHQVCVYKHPGLALSTSCSSRWAEHPRLDSDLFRH